MRAVSSRVGRSSSLVSTQFCWGITLLRLTSTLFLIMVEGQREIQNWNENLAPSCSVGAPVTEKSQIFPAIFALIIKSTWRMTHCEMAQPFRLWVSQNSTPVGAPNFLMTLFMAVWHIARWHAIFCAKNVASRSFVLANLPREAFSFIQLGKVHKIIHSNPSAFPFQAWQGRDPTRLRYQTPRYQREQEVFLRDSSRYCTIHMLVSSRYYFNN